MQSLKEYMRALSQQWGDTYGPAKYETIAAKLGVTITTVGNLMGGIVSKRSTVCRMADYAKLPRVPFLRASGYIPQLEDEEWDRQHFPSLQEASEPKQTRDHYASSAPFILFPVKGERDGASPDGNSHATANGFSAPSGHDDSLSLVLRYLEQIQGEIEETNRHLQSLNEALAYTREIVAEEYRLQAPIEDEMEWSK
jgi:hypothetical protein